MSGNDLNLGSIQGGPSGSPGAGNEPSAAEL